MLKKNEIVKLEITGMTNEGNGVGRYNEIAVFVPFTAVGDVISCKIVKVSKSYCYGIAERFISEAETRISPNCQVFGKCGGCSFRHFSYEEELRVKQDFVESSFRRIGKLEPEFEAILGCEKIDGYRNKAQYPVSQADGKMVCGFYSKRSHRVIGFTDCRLQPEIFSEIVKDIIDFCNENNVSAYNEVSESGLLRHIYLRKGEHTDEIMVCLVVTSIKKSLLFHALAETLTKKYSGIKSIVLNENSRKTNVILGSRLKTIYGKDTITDIMCGKKFELSPLSFYQVNTVQAESLYCIAKEYAGLVGSEILLDLYCGAGTIGLSMSDSVKKLIGVEIIPSAVDNAKRNAAQNGITNAEFICADAEQAAEMLYQRGERPDVIIADPARKGCSAEALKYMAKMNPDRIVMISCNHATAARDCAILEELGYKTVKCRAVDMFPRSTHVETVCLLSKLQTKQHIDIELNTDELDLTSSESKATYDEIKAYVKEHAGLTVSSLNIAQVKKKCGIIERENYNKAKSGDAKQPKCPKDKKVAIMEALKLF